VTGALDEGWPELTRLAVVGVSAWSLTEALEDEGEEEFNVFIAAALDEGSVANAASSSSESSPCTAIAVGGL
jgi:hypothetical protein